MSGQNTLYLVATPIGHRDDIGLRAIEVLRTVSRVFAEDTRRSLPLLRHHGIPTPVEALHEHNEAARAERIAARLAGGEGGDVALVSDAGTPLVSDPGYRLVRACIGAGVEVRVVPGPCALVAALAVSGLPTDRFEFVGFPPSRSGARREWLGALGSRAHTLVLYESPHRIEATLGDVVHAFGDERPVALARELTKRFETVLRGTAAEVLERVATDPDQRRGEFAVVVGGKPARGVRAAGRAGSAAGAGGEAGHGPDGDAEAAAGAVVELDRLIVALAAHLPPKAVAKLAQELLGVSRRAAYDRAVALASR